MQNIYIHYMYLNIPTVYSRVKSFTPKNAGVRMKPLRVVWHRRDAIFASLHSIDFLNAA